MDNGAARRRAALESVGPGAGASADRSGKLKTILRNLVHNALKFTEQGEVRVTATADGASGDDAAVRIVVEDTGCGMPPEALGYVFEMFRQIPGSSGGGVGLGLHIVRRVRRGSARRSRSRARRTGSRFTLVMKSGLETSDEVSTAAA